MKMFWLNILCCIVCTVAFGQKITYPQLKKSAATINEFVPNGWAIWAVSYGDLNKDKLQDAVVVIQQQSLDFIKTKGNGEQAIEYDANPRVVMVLFKKAAGGYTLADFSNTFVLRNSNPDRVDPFQAATINGSGILALDYNIYYHSGDKEMINATYKFRYQNNNFEMIGAEILGVTKSTGASVDYSFNFMTKKVCITKKNIYKQAKADAEWQTFQLDKPKGLQELLQPFTWDINDIRL